MRIVLDKLKASVCAALLFCTAAHAAKADAVDDIKKRGKIIVGVKTDYRPFGFRSSDGEIVGFEPDLARDVAERLGVKLELVPVAASNRLVFLQQGKIDLMIATMTDTEERRKIVRIVQPDYYASGTNVMILKDLKVKSWEDLRNRNICLMQGSFYNREVQEKYGIKPLAFKGTTELFAALKSGNCVGAVFDDTALYGQMAESGWDSFEIPLESILVQPWGLAVSLDQPNFAEFMSKVVEDWHKSGFLISTAKKYQIRPSKFSEDMHNFYSKQ